MDLKKVCIISAILLIIAIIPNLSYGYYQLLRIIIFIASAFVAWKFYESQILTWTWIFGAVAFLFNPLLPIYLSRSSWIPIDFISAILFFVAANSLKKDHKK